MTGAKDPVTVASSNGLPEDTRVAEELQVEQVKEPQVEEIDGEYESQDGWGYRCLLEG